MKHEFMNLKEGKGHTAWFRGRKREKKISSLNIASRLGFARARELAEWEKIVLAR